LKTTALWFTKFNFLGLGIQLPQVKIKTKKIIAGGYGDVSFLTWPKL